MSEWSLCNFWSWDHVIQSTCRRFGILKDVLASESCKDLEKEAREDLIEGRPQIAPTHNLIPEHFNNIVESFSFPPTWVSSWSSVAPSVTRSWGGVVSFCCSCFISSSCFLLASSSWGTWWRGGRGKRWEERWSNKGGEREGSAWEWFWVFLSSYYIIQYNTI